MIASLDARRLRPGALRPPPSKSDAQRALVLAHGLARPALSASLARWAPGELPADVRVVGDTMPRLSSPAASIDIDCGDGGAPLRLLVAQAAIAAGCEARFTGSPRLAERPHAALLDALRATLGDAGLQIAAGDPWPLVVRGAGYAAEPSFRVAADESSQPLSALLLAAAVLAAREGRSWSVEPTTPVASAGYLELTCAWLAHAGVPLGRAGARFTVGPAASPPGRAQVPGDWSSIGYLLAAAWRSGGWVEGVDLAAAHPDRAIVEQLRSIGLEVAVAGDRAEVRGTAVAGFDAVVADAPDLAPTLAALACTLPAPSRLRAVAILRHKESDRVIGVRDLATAGGARVRIEGEEILIEPGVVPAEVDIDAHGDHRLAMAGATLAMAAGTRARIDGAEHVGKSFPRFWDTLSAIGVNVVLER